MEKYKIEYLELKSRLKIIKQEIQEIIVKYDSDDWMNKLMVVLSQLYEERKGDREEYDSDILYNYRDDCGVPIEYLEAVMELFVERKVTKRRMWFIKWLVLRKFLYY